MDSYDAVGVPGLPAQEIDPLALGVTDQWIQPLNGLVDVFWWLDQALPNGIGALKRQIRIRREHGFDRAGGRRMDRGDGNGDRRGGSQFSKDSQQRLGGSGVAQLRLGRRGNLKVDAPLTRQVFQPLGRNIALKQVDDIIFRKGLGCGLRLCRCENHGGAKKAGE